MSGTRIRCFAADVDGTIADYTGRIDLDAAATLRRLDDLGYPVIFVSGRSAWELYMLAAYIGTTLLSVGENGGVISTSPSDIRLLGDNSYGLMAYDYLSKRIKDVEIKPTMPRFTEVVLKRSFDLDEGRKILDESSLPVKMVDSTFAYHISNRDVSKGNGLKIALQQLGINPSETVAIGDSDTDISMFETCGYSIAVGNATEGALKHAKYKVNGQLGAGLIEAVQLAFQKLIGNNFEDLVKKGK